MALPSRVGYGPAPAAERPDVVAFPLGSLYNHLVSSDAYTAFSHEGSKDPDERLYNPALSPLSPFTFDVANYVVPKNQFLVVLGYSFAADRCGGVDPYDTQPVELGRMRGSWIWDLTVSGTRPDRQLHFEIVPTPIVQAGAGTGLVQLPAQNAFAASGARLAQSIGGAGLAGLPFDGRVYGAEGVPFTLTVKQGLTVAARVSLIRPMSIPLASIRARIDGFLFPESLYETYLSLLKT